MPAIGGTGPESFPGRELHLRRCMRPARLSLTAAALPRLVLAAYEVVCSNVWNCASDSSERNHPRQTPGSGAGRRLGRTLCAPSEANGRPAEAHGSPASSVGAPLSVPSVGKWSRSCAQNVTISPTQAGFRSRNPRRGGSSVPPDVGSGERSEFHQEFRPFATINSQPEPPDTQPQALPPAVTTPPSAVSTWAVIQSASSEAR